MGDKAVSVKEFSAFMFHTSDRIENRLKLLEDALGQHASTFDAVNRNFKKLAQILAVEINYKDFNTFEEILQPKFTFESSLVDEVRLELRAITSAVLKGAEQEKEAQAAPEPDPSIPEKDLGTKSDSQPNDKKKKPKAL